MMDFPRYDLRAIHVETDNTVTITVYAGSEEDQHYMADLREAISASPKFTNVKLTRKQWVEDRL